MLQQVLRLRNSQRARVTSLRMTRVFGGGKRTGNGRGAVWAGKGLGREAGFSTAAAGAPSSVEMTVDCEESGSRVARMPTLATIKLSRRWGTWLWLVDDVSFTRRVRRDEWVYRDFVGWGGERFGRSANTPPFAKSAKDGAPDLWLFEG